MVLQVKWEPLGNSLDLYGSAASFTKSYAVSNSPIRSKANLLCCVLTEFLGQQ